ncbi:nucleotidyltransferase domain-containing protein [Limnobacter sp.]|uniref:nucleotidyltransferase domain-containing protein n=1 Tax=Limnobacter sp. TaxID=2003368 RepID=UPI0027345654|nr:nucleotidyltransferase domain-containing protein [Limnobacter sp.]MDP3187567.1 nucleotidyltransferase domain-containing protein [Limnobacter sp.]
MGPSHSELKIQNHELQIVLDLLEKHVPNHVVWAFGSRVGGSPKPFSDLDLVLIDSKPLPLGIRAELNNAFSESDLPWKVDLVDWHSISPDFQKIIQANYQILQNPASIKPSK